MPLTPQDVRDKVFRPTRMRRGYDEDEVDGFLDEVEAELGRLLNEIGELQRQLQAQGGGPPYPAPTQAGAAQALEPGAPTGPELTKSRAAPVPVEAAEHVPAAALPAGQQVPQQTAPQPTADRPPHPEPVAPAPGAPAADLDRLPDSEAEQLLRRTLVLAQRTAEQAIQEARVDAERLRGDAQRTYDEQIGRVEEDRRRLEGQVDQLRSFEREYRTRLRAYLELQLRELDKAGAPQTGPGAVPGSARPPLTQGTPSPAGPGAAGTAGTAAAAPGRLPAAGQSQGLQGGPSPGAAGSAPGRPDSPFSAPPPVGGAQGPGAFPQGASTSPGAGGAPDSGPGGPAPSAPSAPSAASAPSQRAEPADQGHAGPGPGLTPGPG
ncbi:MAG: DivIVA domain-containing protein [Frankiaceae bacterium]